MAQYNADIRVGITGKTQLNALEKQLGRINKDLNQINKNLKAQTLTINTKGATRALAQLDRKINKLNRTINVNANINEKRNTSSSGGGTLFVSNGAAQQLAVAKAAQPIAKALTNEAQDLLDAEVARNKAIGETVELRKKINDQIEKQRKLERNINTVENSSNEKARTANMNRLFGGNVSKAGNKLSPKQSLALAKQESDRLNGSITRLGKAYQANLPVVTKTSKAYQEIAGAAKKAAAAENEATASAVKSAAARKKFGKGFGTGAGIAGASALGGIPVLGDAVTGGLAAGLSGGSVAAGVFGGALVGIGVAAAGAIAEVTRFNNALTLQQKALANTVATADELEAALAAIENVSKDFVVPIGDATAQFTKLNAAARASGFGVEEVEEVYRGLAAANVALGGDAERLNGILLATQQVFSKGKVQAEELRGQIGERLAGAFAKFAKSAGLSTSELDKALERGEVSLEDFVRFSKSLLEEYEDDAKKLADAPENASARLKQAMDDLKRAMGPILTDIGNFFIQLANTIVKQLTRMFNALNEFRRRAAQGLQDRAAANLAETSKQIQEASNNRGNGFGQVSDREMGLLQDRLETQAQQYLNATKELQSLEANLEASGKPKPPKPPKTVLDEDKPKGGSGRSSSGPRDTAAELRAAIAAQKELLQIEQERFGLTERELELRSFDDARLKVQIALTQELADIQRDNITAESKTLASTLAKLEAETDLQQIKNEQQQYEDAIAADIQQQINDLETQITVEEAITEEMKEQAILAARIAEIQNGPGEEGDKQRLINAENRLKEARDGNQGVSGYMKQLQSELMDTETMIVSLAQTVETEIGSAMSSAITGLIDGTKTAQEAFADMFANIGKAFIDMATQMIAKALVMKALGILFPGASGGFGSGASAPVFGGSSTFSGAFSGGTGVPNFFGYANGGRPPVNEVSLVGERGPELFVPSTSGTVYNNNDLRSAMSDYSGANGASTYDASTMNINVETTTINGMEFITPEQFRKGLDTAANKGAKLGENKAMNRLRNSRSTRTKLGM